LADRLANGFKPCLTLRLLPENALSPSFDFRPIGFQLYEVDDLGRIGVRPALRFPVTLRQGRVDDGLLVCDGLSLLIGTRLLLGDFCRDQLGLLQYPNNGRPHLSFSHIGAEAPGTA
jgi:hypothetical protein